MKQHTYRRLRFALTAACGLCSLAALAGRPLDVDDANVDAAGQGHVEAWLARAPGAKAYNLAPAYVLIEGVELSALVARDTRAAVTLSGLQAKWRITPSQDQGCNTATTLAWQHATGAPGTAYLNGIVTCNGVASGSVHMNLGVAKARGASAAGSWGLAYEREFMGVTPNVEWFGSRGSKPTLQTGLRGQVAKNLQLDGSVGRRGGAMLYTLGTKLQF